MNDESYPEDAGHRAPFTVEEASDENKPDGKTRLPNSGIGWFKIQKGTCHFKTIWGPDHAEYENAMQANNVAWQVMNYNSAYQRAGQKQNVSYTVNGDRPSPYGDHPYAFNNDPKDGILPCGPMEPMECEDHYALGFAALVRPGGMSDGKPSLVKKVINTASARAYRAAQTIDCKYWDYTEGCDNAGVDTEPSFYLGFACFCATEGGINWVYLAMAQHKHRCAFWRWTYPWDPAPPEVVEELDSEAPPTSTDGGRAVPTPKAK